MGWKFSCSTVKAQVSEWAASFCKSVGFAFEGSNPSPATRLKRASDLGVRRSGALLRCPAVSDWIRGFARVAVGNTRGSSGRRAPGSARVRVRSEPPRPIAAAASIV